MRSIVFLAALFLPFLVFAQNEPVREANYSAAARYSPAKVRQMVYSTFVDAHWLKSGDKFWYNFRTSEGEKYYLVDPNRRLKNELFDNAKMAADMSRLTGDPFDAKHLNIDNIKFIENETAIRFEVTSKLVEEEEKEDGDDQDSDSRRNRKSSTKPKVWYFKYTLSNRVLELLEDYEKPEDDKRWAAIAPDRSYVLFSRNFNLYSMDWENYQKALEDEEDSTIVENQITTDGVRYNGYGGFRRGTTNVEEEKEKDKRQSPGRIWFSTDSKKFVTIRTDSREVKDLWVINNAANPRPTLETYKYQMPGEKEAPSYSMEVFNYPSGDKTTIDVDAFQDQTIGVFRKSLKPSSRDDQYRPSIWLSESNNEIYFQRTSRDLKRIDICLADANTGEVKVLVEERLNTYIEINNPYLVNNGTEIIHWSERDGWGHLYLYDNNGNVKNQITSGSYHVEDIEYVDERNRVIYFMANGREMGEDPYYTHLYRINFDGSGLKLLTPGNYNFGVSGGDTGKYFVANYSRVNTVPQAELYDNSGRKVLDLETADLSKLFESGYRFPEPYTVKAADGITDLYGVMYKPFDFDSTKSYPLILYVYPGPQTEAVNKSFSSRMDRLDRQAQFGFVVVTIGNRGGHPSRSKWYHNYGYGNLRDYGLADKKYAAEQLADRHGFINIDRVGIFGHSGGGFMSTAAMLVYPDFFKVAVSSSGNHDNNVYNRWWSEKHHGVEEIEDEEGNVSFEYDIEKNSELADNLKGKLLLTTGDIDNNVHPAGTLRMANALIKANKRFDFFMFTTQRHGYGNMNEYFFWLRSDYFCKYLIGDYKWDADIKEMNRDKPMTR